MANYCSAVRTNYFKIKDIDKFNSLCASLDGSDVKFEVTEKCGQNFASIWGFDITYRIKNSEDTDHVCDNIDEFFDKMKDIVADGDAMIWTEIGREKLKYLVGFVCIVTSEQVQFINLENIAIDKAKTMLNNENWETQNNY